MKPRIPLLFVSSASTAFAFSQPHTIPTRTQSLAFSITPQPDLLLSEPIATSILPSQTISSISSVFTSSPEVSTPSSALDHDSELRKRQGGVAVSNPTPPATVAVQMPTVTNYVIWGGPAIVYTQTFVPFPDPWPTAQAGNIGLGTIQGTVGVVRTSKRDVAMAEETGRTLRIRGRAVDVP